MKTLNPYIGFNGRCREAMTFYQECFGGELELQNLRDTPMGANAPAELKDNVLHSALTNGHIIIMGSDMAWPGGFVKGSDMAISIACSSEEEINTLFGKLSEGGKIFDPLQLQFWGALFGSLQDKFGVRWILNCEKGQ